jgi:hypothetical protein
MGKTLAVLTTEKPTNHRGCLWGTHQHQLIAMALEANTALRIARPQFLNSGFNLRWRNFKYASQLLKCNRLTGYEQYSFDKLQ